MTTVRELLLKAADHCDHTGLHKGEYWPGALDGAFYADGDPCCAQGHIAVAAGFRDGTRADLLGLTIQPEPADEAVLAMEMHVGGLLPQWSDAPERTAAHVSAALRAAADENEQGEL